MKNVPTSSTLRRQSHGTMNQSICLKEHHVINPKYGVTPSRLATPLARMIRLPLSRRRPDGVRCIFRLRASPPRSDSTLPHTSLYLKTWEAGPVAFHALVARVSLHTTPPRNRNRVWRAGFN